MPFITFFPIWEFLRLFPFADYPHHLSTENSMVDLCELSPKATVVGLGRDSDRAVPFAKACSERITDGN